MSEYAQDTPASRLPSRLGLAVLIAANLLIGVQALHWEWGYYQVLLIYWCEALVIGGYNVLRLLVVGIFGDQPFGAWISRWVSVSLGGRLLGTLLGAGFFIVKFGGFALATGFLLLVLPAYFDSADSRPAQAVIDGLRGSGRGVWIAVCILLASHGVSFAWNFIWKREFAQQSVLGLIFWPYARMALVLAVLVVGLLLMVLSPGLASAPLMVGAFLLVKTVADAAAHLWEHRELASRQPATRAGQAQIA